MLFAMGLWFRSLDLGAQEHRREECKKEKMVGAMQGIG